ncbi:MAG: twin-arginine translocase subunit TatC [Calditrichaeota bacterium]|nr:twin-arginine translocase subunit TatC [Calditrichota bacterium]
MTTEEHPQSEDSDIKSDPSRGTSRQTMDFLTHLEELRKRLIRAILILLGGALVCLIFSEYLLGIITATFPVDDTSYLALLQPTEGFVVRLKVAFVAGLFLSSPFWFAQLWGFISPGLFKNEKRIIYPVIILSAIAFISGAVFGYWILPHAAEYFRSFALSGMAVSWSLGKYLDFSLRILVAFAIVFELPLIVYLLARLGVVTTKQLRKYRKHVIIGLMVASGLITPPDIFTMIALVIPLIILYEIGIITASIAVRKRVATA